MARDPVVGSGDAQFAQERFGWHRLIWARRSRRPVDAVVRVDVVVRQPGGHEWIGPDGAGIATARLADTSGYFGRCVQTLVIEKR